MVHIAHGMRVLFAVLYFVGASFHFVMGIVNPAFYHQLTANAEIDLYQHLFASLQSSGALVLGITLAGLELCLAALILMRGKRVLRGLLLSMIYQVALIPLGLTGLVNALIALAHVPVILIETDQQVPLFRHPVDTHSPFLTEQH